MSKSKIDIISTDEMISRLELIKVKLDRYISYLDESSKNQILKAKEDNIFLILDETFSTSELRLIRNCLSTRNINNFIVNYEERILNDKTYNYKYKVTKTRRDECIVIEVLASEISFWEPTDDFKYYIAKMKKEKENILFKKIVSSFYKNNYPFDNPEKIKNISNSELEYLINLLNDKGKYFDIMLKEIWTHNDIPLKAFEIEKTRDLIYSCAFKLDFDKSLSEQEILLINQLINQKKYNLLLNFKFREKK